MIRKSTLLRLLYLTLLAALASFGVLNVTAQPAYAVYCAPFFPIGCYSIGPQVFDDAVCCFYRCPDFSIQMGACYHQSPRSPSRAWRYASR